MSYISIVRGKIIETTGGSDTIYAKSITYSAQGTISLTGKEEGVEYSNNPASPPVVARISSNCMVEFRTKQDGTYTGQFGFDWLRENDNSLTTEAKYYDCLVNGYEAPNGRAPHRDANTQYENKDEAYKALKKEYKNIPILIDFNSAVAGLNSNRIPSVGTNNVPATTPVTPPMDYFVPYLNLFSKPYSDATVVPTGMPKPPFEAELRTLIEVGGTDEPDQVRVVFDKRYFEINGSNGDDANPVLLDKTIGAKRNGATILIKCIADFDSYQEIKVYNYPKGTLARPLPEQLAKRELAGKIIVGANKNGTGQGAVKNVKKQKFVLVKITTNITGLSRGSKTGSFTADEKVNFQNCLYQSLIIGEFTDKDASGADLVLDLSTNPSFQVGGKYYDVRTGGYNEDYRLNATDKTPYFFRDIKAAFLAMPGNSIYNNHYTIFTLGEAVYDNAAGQAEDINVKNLLLYMNRNNRTMCHEGMHGLGLYHAHADGIISKPNQKFVYVHAHTNSTLGTDNYMSYNGALRKSTWRWQWKIMKSNIL